MHLNQILCSLFLAALSMLIDLQMHCTLCTTENTVSWPSQCYVPSFQMRAIKGRTCTMYMHGRLARDKVAWALNDVWQFPGCKHCEGKCLSRQRWEWNCKVGDMVVEFNTPVKPFVCVGKVVNWSCTDIHVHVTWLMETASFIQSIKEGLCLQLAHIPWWNSLLHLHSCLIILIFAN